VEDVTADETGIDGEVRELSAEIVKSPGEERGDSESGEGEWSLLAPGDKSGSLSDWSEELALSIPAISAEALLFDNFLNKLLVFLRLSASFFLCLNFAAVTVLFAILMLLGSLLLPPVLMLVDSRGVALTVTASPPET